MGQGPGAFHVALIGALLLASGPGTAPAAEQAAADLRWRLEAADGIPGNVRVVYVPEREEPFVVEATWTGRGLAGLWLEDAAGRTLRRAAGASPLVLEGLVDGKPRPRGERLVIRFAPMTARGRLEGSLQILPGQAVSTGAAEGERPAPATAAVVGTRAEPPAVVTGPGACLAPSFGDDAPGRALQALAESLVRATPASLEWARRWTSSLAAAAGRTELDKTSRGALDQLWADLDAPPDAAVGSAFRQLLAAVEELVRRELKSPEHAPSVRARRTEIVGRLACLAPAK